MKRKTILSILLVGSLLASSMCFAGFEEGLSAYDKGDFATAIRNWKPLADQGDALAQNKLGVMYGNGQGVPQDDKQAVGWYRKAAEQGNARAQSNLGGMYRQGHGVPQDNKEAATWTRKAAEQGDAYAQSNLGAMYSQGHGMPQDNKEAVAWFRKAAEQGDGFAQSNLGTMYYLGKGVPQLTVVAYALYNLSEAGDSSDRATNNRAVLANSMTPSEIKAAQNLAREMAKPGNLLKALDQHDNRTAVKEAQKSVASEAVTAYQKGDFATAIRNWRSLAEQGDVSAQFNLGVMYANGQGVPQGHKEAVAWYRKAAERGDADAQSNLGAMYGQGHGVPQDYKEAMVWYRKAADQGNATAQHNLGLMYANGQGVPQDHKEAVDWYRKAAEQGDANAQNNLGVMYKKGQGVAQLNVVAYALYNLSAAKDTSEGNKAPGNRMVLADLMATKEIVAAQNLTREMAKQGNLLKALDQYVKRPAVKEVPKPVASKAVLKQVAAHVKTSKASTGGDCRPRTSSLRCQSNCVNGDCVVTYENGCKMRVQVNSQYNSFNNQWEYPSPGC